MGHPVGIFVARSLQGSTHARGAYLLRLALLAAFLIALASAVAASSLLGAPGLRLFGAITALNLVVVCISGPAYFASVITEEKQAGTLGLLKMAGIEPLALLLGKCGGRLLAALMLLVVQLPFTVAAVTLGGITLRQVFAGYLSIAAFLLLVGNAGLLCSVVHRTTSGAAVQCMGFELLIILAPVLAGALSGAPAGSRPAYLLAGLSPFERMDQVMSTGFAGPVVGFQVVSNLVLAAVCFLLAWVAFESRTREDTWAAPTADLPVRHVRRPSGHGPGRVWGNALAWKEFHFVSGGRLGLAARFVVVGLFPLLMVPIALAQGDNPTMAESGKLIVSVSLAGILIELVTGAERLFGHERQWHTLTTVMRLPGSSGRLVWNKVLGASIGLLPYAAWLVMGGAMMGYGSLEGLSFALTNPYFWFCLAFAALYLHMVVYMSLCVRHGAVVVGGLLALVLGLCMLPVAAVALIIVPHPAAFAAALLAELVLVTRVLQRSIRDRLARTAELE